MIELHQPYYRNIVNMMGNDPDTYLVPLRIPVTALEWPSLCNPSVFIDGDNVRMILRNVNYILHNSIHPYQCWSGWGPCEYLIPQWDHPHLRTRNFLCEYTQNSIGWKLIDTTEHDKEPIWDFVGLEDARLVRWDGRLLAIGVRRDDNEKGKGRMEISEINEDGKELSRTKIEVPWDSYCEKNWVPIIDLPWHFMRTSNPVCIVKVNPEDLGKEMMAEIVVEKDMRDVGPVPGIYNATWQGETLFRGSSQVIPYKKDKHIATVHTCELWLNELGRKVPKYLHHVVVWDKDWNLERVSPSFSFNDYNIEFSNGLAYKDGVFYLPFALQDNFSYMMEISEKSMDNLISGDLNRVENHEFLPNASIYYDDYDGFELMDKEAWWCLNNGYLSEAYTRLYRSYERSYEFPISREKQLWYLLNIAKSLGWGVRDDTVHNVIFEIESIGGDNPEVLMFIAEYFMYKDMPGMAHTYVTRAQRSMPHDYDFIYMDKDNYYQILNKVMKDVWSWRQDYNITDDEKIPEIVL